MIAMVPKVIDSGLASAGVDLILDNIAKRQKAVIPKIIKIVEIIHNFRGDLIKLQKSGVSYTGIELCRVNRRTSISWQKRLTKETSGPAS